jgi:putative glutamine amidotransferase
MVGMKPRIAIPVPTSKDVAYNQRSWATYAECVERAGGEAVRVELGSARRDLLELARTCSGVCLPGSPADVEPARYGAERDSATAPADAAREAVDTVLLEDAEAHAKPVLAICFGVQMLNVWRGGSLVQDLTPVPVNHSAGGKVAVAHTAVVAEHSLLASLLEEAEAPLVDGFRRLPVNTSHHQAVAAPGTGLRIVARCPEDGTVEAVELEGDAPGEGDGRQWVMGVQWHPERSYDISAASRALFARLVHEAGAVMTRETSEEAAVGRT